MLKLTIPYTITSAIISAVSAITTEISLVEKTNIKLKKHLNKIDERDAKKCGLTLEEYNIRFPRNTFDSLEKMIESFGTEKETKVFSIKHNDEGVCISVNDAFIVDQIECMTHTMKRLLNPLADTSVILDEEIERSKGILSKWKKEPESIISDKIKSETVEQVLSLKENNTFQTKWKLTTSISQPIIKAYYGKKIDCIELPVSEVLDIVIKYKHNVTIHELVKEHNLSYSLIKAIVHKYDAK